MAFLRFDGATRGVDLADAALVTFSFTLEASPTAWRYRTPNGDTVELAGSGFTFGADGKPTGGVVSSVQIDTEARGGVRDVILTGLNASLAAMTEPAGFWNQALAGNDVISLAGLAGAKVGPQQISRVIGDDFAAAAASSAVVSDRGGNDVFIASDGAYAAIGDVAGVFAGENRFATYAGGADRINGVSTPFRQDAIGDASEVRDRGHVIGGADTLSSASRNPFSQLVGDAGLAQGTAAGLARVTGGADTITGLSPSGTPASEAMLIGDVGALHDFGTITGGDDRITGGAGSEEISGDLGFDLSATGSRLDGGHDVIDAGAGDDVVAGDVLANRDLNLGRPARPGEPSSRPTGEALVTGGDDVIRGGAGDDRIFGEIASDAPSDLVGVSGGGDRLSGDGGDDEIHGQTGRDTIEGGGDADFLLGGAGADRIFGEVEAGSVGDSLSFDDRLFGEAGADDLRGQLGDDLLVGGAGADRLDGGEGVDTVSYAGSSGVTANLANAASNTRDAAGDRYFGVENLEGSGGGDRLTGDAANNQITGGGGVDVLSGGAGRDVFVFRNAGELTGGGNDRITDFATVDRIDLRGVDASLFGDGDQAFAFLGAGRFSGLPGQLRVEREDDRTLVQADLDGDGLANFTLELDGAFSMKSAFFLL